MVNTSSISFVRQITTSLLRFHLSALFLFLLVHFYIPAQSQEQGLNIQPAYFLICSEKLGDLGQWQTRFNEQAGKSDSHGLMPIGFANDAENKDAVIVGYVVLDLEKAKQYVSSGQMKADLIKLGAMDSPELRFLYCLDEMDDDSGNRNLLVITQKAKDYDLWRGKFFASEKERLISGLKYVAIVKTIDQPDEISVIFTYYDIDVAKEFVKSKYLKGAMSDAGINGPVTSQYIVLPGDESGQKAQQPEKIGLAAGKLTLELATNVNCSYQDNTAGSGKITVGAITKIQLPKGKYSFLFASLANPADSIRINYTIDKTGVEDVLFADLQSVIHKRVVKEPSPADKPNPSNPFDMVLVKGGSFRMGNDSLSSEMKAHTVTVKDFYIGKYEVTQKQWREVMGNNPSYFQGCNDCPVENVSQEDAIKFIGKLNTKTGLKYRLPTEAEWEYAAIGGSQSQHYTFSGGNNIEEVAWCNSNSWNETHPVGQKKPNELGIYDMTGNVFEWCSDWFSYTYYQDGPATNPVGPSQGIWKVVRGGAWCKTGNESLPGFRTKGEPSLRTRTAGFRLARDK